MLSYGCYFITIQEIQSPRSPKLFFLAKSEGIQTTLKDVKKKLSSRTEEQQSKESRHTKQSHGPIVSYNPFDSLQLDIFVFKKYESSNKGFGYILCIENSEEQRLTV